jgi:stage V sporulation protein D (sporulation-specific penicillin-binding protein)
MPFGPGLTMKKRMLFLMATLFGAGFAVLIARMAVIQLVQGSFWSRKASAQQMSSVTVSASRGTIYDRNMKVLAQSATVWDVALAPAYIKTEAQRANIADNLSAILGADRAKIYEQTGKKTSCVIVTKKIEKSVADLVNKYVADNNINGVFLVEDSKRYYPFGNFASQIIGFTGTDNQGLGGLEARYDSWLRGKSGKLVTAKNAVGTEMPFRYSETVPPESGCDIVTTIDEVVQSSLENNLRKAVSDNNVTAKATAIVMDVKNGEILGMATSGGYDPNSPYEITDKLLLGSLGGKTGSDLAQAKAYALNTQWRNKAITDPNEPGSVFKVVTAAAGLDTGVVKEDSQFFDPGFIKVGDKNFHCWKAGGHGSQTFLQGFENSCNVVFVAVGQRLGARNFSKYFDNFGLSAKTGIDLPGEATSIYYKEKDLGPVELASCSFGQSNKMTPIELVTAIAAAANGGKLVTPHLVREIKKGSSTVKTYGAAIRAQAVSAATSSEICRLMQLEVIEGTGKNAYVPGYRIGGKTGTSQKLDSPDKSARIASFVGIAPCDDPRIALLVILDEPHAQSNYGGVIAAPVAGSIFSEILPYLGVAPKYTDAEKQKVQAGTPDITGKEVPAAQAAAQAAGLKLSVSGSGGTVTSQMPAAGETIAPGGTVIAYTSGEIPQKVKVPSLTGMTPEQANAALAAAGLNIRFEGVAQDAKGDAAYDQDAAAGEEVSRGTVVTVKFRDQGVRDDGSQ